MHIPTLYKRFFLCGVALLALLPSIHAQTGSVPDASGRPVVLYFRFDKAVVDSGYMDNARTLRHLGEVLSDPRLAERIDSIHILSFASPEGDRQHNERLARQRSIAVKGYLVWKYPHLNQYRIHPRPQGENWQELRRLIAEDGELPNRDEVLQIIDRVPDADRCKALLRKLDGGSSYRYINNRLLRYLRNASVCTVWLRPAILPALPPPAAPHFGQTLRKPVEAIPATPVTNAPPALRKRPLFALKTNLLFDAALMPNVEIEIPLGTRWSLNAEYMFPWWLFEGDKYALQILMGGLEGRYWLGSRAGRERREVLTGHFLGLYAGGGKYDLQWKESGYQGEFFIAAGISYGWATRIARNLHLEFNIGIGVLRTDYRHYHAQNHYQTLLWQENGQYTWFGPTKAKISLVWLLNGKAKKGGGE